MKKRFHIEKIGNPEDWDDPILSRMVKFTSNPILLRYMNYGLIFEDMRTIAHLNKRYFASQIIFYEDFQ